MHPSGSFFIPFTQSQQRILLMNLSIVRHLLGDLLGNGDDLVQGRPVVLWPILSSSPPARRRPAGSSSRPRTLTRTASGRIGPLLRQAGAGMFGVQAQASGRMTGHSGFRGFFGAVPLLGRGCFFTGAVFALGWAVARFFGGLVMRNFCLAWRQRQVGDRLHRLSPAGTTPSPPRRWCGGCSVPASDSRPLLASPP